MIACGSYALPVTGTLIFTNDEERSRVHDLQILTAHFRDGVWIGKLRPVNAIIGPGNEFSFEAGGSYSVREVCRDGKWDSVEIFLQVHHLFRAPGCVDVVVASTREANVHTITMDCAP